MSSSVAPLFPKTSVFIPAYWASVRSEILTQEEADARYLKFPVGQGTESIPNLIVSGTSTLGITSTNALTATQFTATTGSYGLSQKFYGSTADTYPFELTTESANFYNKYIRLRQTANNATPTQGTFLCANYTGQAYSSLELISGTSTIYPKTTLQSFVDYTAFYGYGSTCNKLILGEDTASGGLGSDIVLSNGDVANDLPENKIVLHDDGSYSNNYIQLRVAFDYAGESSEFKLGYNFLNWSILNLDVMNINASNDRIELKRNMRQDTRSDDGSTTGILETGVINATTTGTTTLTFATSAFRTTINTPTLAGRIFVLPVPSASNAGYWLGFCNKSTAFTIAIQYPAATTIFTIPVATNATNGGSSARFAVGPNPYTYIKIA